MRIKKIIALCVFAILIPIYASAQTDDSKFDTAYTLLHDLNVLEEMPSETDSSVTRGDFVDMFIKALNIDLTSTPQISAFSDVYHSDENYAAINAGYELGYIEGYDDDKFRPDDNIEFTHCVGLANKALGYAKLGLNILSQTNKLGEDITKTNGEMSYRDAVVFIYNMLNEKSMKADYSKIPLQYVQSDNTLLYDMWNIYSVSGQITQTAYTGLNTAADCGKDNIAVDGVIYKCFLPNINDKLGFCVTAFVCDKDDENVVVSVADKRNKIINLKADTLRESEYKNNTFEYTDASGKARKLKMLPAVDIIYNGVFAGSQFERSLITNMNVGEIDIIDSDNDGVYDVLKVYDYKMLTAANNTTENAQRIYDKYIPKNYIQVDGLNDGDLVSLEIDGRNAEIKEIIFGDLIAYFENTNESGTKIVQMKINRTVTTGVLESVQKDKYVIDGKAFVFNPEMEELSQDNKYGNAPTLGSTQTFYFDYIGQIALVISENQSNMSYGLLCNVYADNEYFIKLFTPSNSYATYEVDEKFSIDGEKIKNLDNISNILEQTKLSICQGSDLYQIVKFSVKDGKILKILTTKSNNDEAPRLDCDFVTRNYKNLGFVFGKEMRDFRADQYTNILFIPTMKDGIDKDRFYWGDLSNMINGDSMNSQAYNVDESGRADLILLSTDFKDSYSSAPPMYLVESNTIVVDENNEIARKITVIYRGTMYNYYTKSGDTETGADLESGDITQLVLDPFNKILYTKQVIDISAPKLLHGFNADGVSSYTAATRYMIGYISNYKNGWATLTYAQDKSADLTQEPYKDLVNIGGVTHSVYTKRDQSVKTGSAANLAGYVSTTGDDYMVFIYSNYGQVVDMVIYDMN